jgi:hypothetical protein
MRALIVLALLGFFCGSAVMMSENLRPPPDALPVLSSAAAQAPFRAQALKKPDDALSAWPAPYVLGSLDHTSHNPRSE